MIKKIHSAIPALLQGMVDMAAHFRLMASCAVMALIAYMYHAVFHSQTAVRTVSFAHTAHYTAGSLPENLLQQFDKRLTFLCMLVCRSYFKLAVCFLGNGKRVNS